MADSIKKSMITGRLLGSLVMAILSAYLANKGMEISEENQQAGAQLIEAAALAFASAIPGVISKIRERNKAQ